MTSFKITSQKEDDRRKGTATKPGIYTLLRSFSHQLLVPSFVPHCLMYQLQVWRNTATAKDLSIDTGNCVFDGSGLQRVARTREPVLDVASCLCLAMLCRKFCVSRGNALTHLRLVHKAMGDEGIASETNSSWLKFCKTVQVPGSGSLVLFSVAFLLSSEFERGHLASYNMCMWLHGTSQLRKGMSREKKQHCLSSWPFS